GTICHSGSDGGRGVRRRAAGAGAMTARQGGLENEAGQISIGRAVGRTEYPLTFNQREMWAQCHLYGDSAVNNLAVEVALDGPLDVDAFRRAFAAVIERH